MRHRRHAQPAFTLVEMMVVLSMVVMVAMMALPNINRALKANADAQAYNMMSAMIKSARTVAIRDGVYACVHHQLADPTSPGGTRLRGVSFLAVLTTASVSGGDIYVDNSQALAPAGWVVDDTYDGMYQSDYLHDDNAAKGTSVSFDTQLSFAGDHDVYMMWPANASNATNVPVDVIHSNGTSTYYVNQRASGGTWVLLGRHPFVAGTARVVIRTDGTSGYVIADGVRFSPVLSITAFGLGPGQVPQKVPGTMTFGELKSASGTSAPGTYSDDSYNADGVGAIGGAGMAAENQRQVDDFTTFSLVFNPGGALTRRPNNEDVLFAMGAYVPGQTSLFGWGDPLWDIAVANADTDGNNNAGEPGAQAITMFDHATFIKQQGDERKDYLDNNAQLMPINSLLGMLLERR